MNQIYDAETSEELLTLASVSDLIKAAVFLSLWGMSNKNNERRYYVWFWAID